MINGMTILKQTAITEPTILVLFGVIGGVLIMISSLLYIFLMEKRNDIGYEIDGEKIYINSLKLVVIGFVIALTSIFLPFFQTESGRYEYTCTFEDYVTVNDITEVYNIISVEDDIWTV